MAILRAVEPDRVGVVDGYLEGAVLFLVSMMSKEIRI
jgi:hypothetical protein